MGKKEDDKKAADEAAAAKASRKSAPAAKPAGEYTIAPGHSMSWGGSVHKPGTEVKLHMLGSDKEGEEGQKKRRGTLVERGVIQHNK